MSEQAMTVRGNGAAATMTAPRVQPRVDVLEAEEAWTILVDLPGVAEEDLELSIERDTLTLDAQPRLHERPGMTLHFSDMAPRGFRRHFTLDERVDRERIAAALDGGVLRITLPRSKEAGPRRIPVGRG